MRFASSPGVLALVVVGASAFSSAPAHAGFEVGVTAGPHTFNEELELGVEDRAGAESLRNSVCFGARLGIMFGSMIGIEAEGGVIPSEGRNVVFDVWTMSARAHVIAQFRAAEAKNKVVPFIVAGGGILNVMKTENPV